MKIGTLFVFFVTIIFGGYFTYKTYNGQLNKDVHSSSIAHFDDMKCKTNNLDPETDTDKYIAEMTKEIRTNVVNQFSEKEGLIYVRGTGADFKRQDRNFLYLSGVQIQVYGHYITIDLATKRSTLFAPKLPPFELIWHHEKLPTRDELKTRFGVDECFWTEEFDTKMKEWSPKKVFLTEEQQLPSNPTNAPVDNKLLTPHLFELRSVKTAKELRILRVVNRVSSNAHRQVMKKIKAGLKEFQIHSLFNHECHNCGFRNQSYEPIVGTGRNAGILHYTTNTATIQDGQMFLIDAGSEYRGYASDITVTYPANGKFSVAQKAIYQAVLNTQLASIREIKVGQTWAHILKFSQMALLKELRDIGLVKGSIEHMHEYKVHSLFQPHGLGHHIGLDVHDTTKLPVGPLKENMVLTIEPGIYFIPYLFENANADQKHYLNMDYIPRFYRFGGVRIEDDIKLEKDGVEFLSGVPRTIKQIEDFMSGSEEL